MATPGGARLRLVRQQVGKTQMWTEIEADLGSGYLQRLESGRVAQPGRATLERILTALGARFSERREVLELFGYTVPITPPSAEEIAWAREVCRRELDTSVFPAYVLDCTIHLLAWNPLFPRLLGVAPDDPLLQQLTERPLPVYFFDPASPLGQLVADPDTFLPSLIRTLRYEMQQVNGEEWFMDIVEEMLETLPFFREYWNRVEQETPPATAARALYPVRLNIPGAGPLEFRLSAEPFTRDSRFRIVYYLPADPHTMRRCAEWAAANPGGAS